jgi:hypothetical protein
MQYLLSRRQINGKFSRWIVILQEYDLEFSTPKSKKSLVLAELITDFPSDAKASPINEDFPDEHLFFIPSDDPWYETSSSTFVHRSLGLISLEMIVDAFAIRPLDTSSSETFSIDAGSTPFFDDVLPSTKPTES